MLDMCPMCGYTTEPLGLHVADHIWTAHSPGEYAERLAQIDDIHKELEIAQRSARMWQLEAELQMRNVRDARLSVGKEIAETIRRELVCCDVYERHAGGPKAGTEHPICFWGEAAARLASDEPDSEKIKARALEYFLERVNRHG